MSNPVTLSLASFAVQAVGTYSGIQAQKAQNKAIIREYETEKKYNQLKGLQDSNDVLEEARKKRKQNLAIVAGSGYNPDSRSFLSIQSEIDRIAQKDINNILSDKNKNIDKEEVLKMLFYHFHLKHQLK